MMEQSLEAICLKNVSAWLKFRKIPAPEPISVSQDRVFYDKTVGMRAAIFAAASDSILVPANYKNHGKTAVMGYREDVGTYSAQVILHTDKIEIDFDYFNPYDVVGIVGHALEVLRNRLRKTKTDPRKVAKKLKERGILKDDDSISG
jgi:hypothetical protein